MQSRNQPRFHRGVVTLPEVDGVSWKADGKDVESGNLDRLDPGESIKIEAVLDENVVTSGKTEWTFSVPQEDSQDTPVEAPAPQRAVPQPPQNDTSNNQ